MLKPIDPRLPTQVRLDYNGFENTPNREPALGNSLWQRHGDDWFPVGYGSRFLRPSEKNLLKRESAYSSSIGESLSFVFALNHYYCELSQLESFEVLCDARNLTYWRTSDSPLLVRLRAKISGKFDISKITVRHIPRRLNYFSDALGRLAQHPLPTEEELSLSTYAYSATDLLSSFVSSNSIPDYFLASDFTLPELGQLRKNKISTRGPVTRSLHGRNLFLVPESARTDDLWQAAHISEETGAHFPLSRTKANLSHLHWKAKSAWIKKRWKTCERCIPARASHDLAPIQEFSGEAMRPTHFGQVVAFDTCGPKATPTGPKHLATSLDGHTGLFQATVIDSPNETSAMLALRHWKRFGKTPEIALFDRAKAYLASAAFRSLLASEGIDPRYSKGDDPRYILGLERVHREFNNWHRTLDDPLLWEEHIDEFIFLVNSLVSEATGFSRSGLAFGQGPAAARALLLRHSSLLRARTDSKELPPPRLRSGERCFILANPKEKNQLALHVVDIVEFGSPLRHPGLFFGAGPPTRRAISFFFRSTVSSAVLWRET